MELREQLEPIYMNLSWRQFARQYFGKSASWLYHKIDGIDPITEKERLEFKKHLLTLSKSIEDCAKHL